jgi:hypothetical protein
MAMAYLLIAKEISEQLKGLLNLPPKFILKGRL